MKNSIFLTLLSLSFISFSQNKEDEKKLIRGVVTVEVDRAKFAPKPFTIAPKVTPVVIDKKGKKPEIVVVETPPEEVVDTLPPLMAAPQSEILKRAQNWYESKNKNFIKANGTNLGQSVTCKVTFTFKQKILNPENDVDGKITMDVIVEAKEGKYRYTIKNIIHVASKNGMSGGDIYAVVPECGSMLLSDRTWKHIRSECFSDAKMIVDDLKSNMKDEAKDKDDW